MSSGVIAAATIQRGLRLDFADTYSRNADKVNPKLSNMVALGTPSDKHEEEYAYFEAAPHPERWIRGESMPVDGFGSVSFKVANVKWAKSIKWNRDDRLDDQLKGLESRARQLGASFAKIPQRVFFQIIEGQTNRKLLSNVPKAPDGADIFAAQDGGGADRFGVTGGNIITGSGTSSVTEVRADVYAALSRIQNFEDQHGEPLNEDGSEGENITIVYPENLNALFAQTFGQTIIPDSNAGVSNIILEAGLKITLWSTPRLNDSIDWFMFAGNEDQKCILEQVRESPVELVQNDTNSDESRNFDVEGVGFKARMGYAPLVPFKCVMVNNT